MGAVGKWSHHTKFRITYSAQLQHYIIDYILWEGTRKDKKPFWETLLQIQKHTPGIAITLPPFLQFA